VYIFVTVLSTYTTAVCWVRTVNHFTQQMFAVITSAMSYEALGVFLVYIRGGYFGVLFTECCIKRGTYVFSRPYWVVRSRLWYDVLSVCRLSV